MRRTSWTAVTVAALALGGVARAQDAPPAGPGEAAPPAAKEPPVEELVLAAFHGDRWADDTARFGDRAVPVVAPLLRDPRPHVVHRAASVLLRIDTDAARAALVPVLAQRTASYPEQVDQAWQEAALPRSWLQPVVEGARGALQLDAARAALWNGGNPEDWFWRSVPARPDLLRRLLDEGPRGYLGRWGWTLGYGIRSEDEETRKAAWRRVDELAALDDAAWRDAAYAHHTVGAFLAYTWRHLDEERLARAVAKLLRDGVVPLEEARRPLLANPLTRASAARCALAGTWTGTAPADLLAVVLDVGVPEVRGRSADFGRRLAGATAAALTPDAVARLARDWPDDGAADARAFLAALADEAPQRAPLLRAFVAALPTPELVSAAFAETARYEKDPRPPAWCFDVAVHALRAGDDASKEKAAHLAFRTWNAQAFVAAERVEDLRALLGVGWGMDSWALAHLRGAGREGWDAIRREVVEGRRPALVEALGATGDPAYLPDVERVFRTVPDALHAATEALVALRGEGALDLLVERVQEGTQEDARTVTGAADGLPPAARSRLVEAALARGADFVDWSHVELDGHDEAEVRRWTHAAFGSRDEDDLSFAVERARRSRSAEFVPRLLALAERDPSNCDDAVAALREIRAAVRELDEARSVAASVAFRQRVGELLASKDVRERRAGVAAAVATAYPGLVDLLVKVALEDPDERVADDARRALVSLGRPAPAESAPEDR